MVSFKSCATEPIVNWGFLFSVTEASTLFYWPSWKKSLHFAAKTLLHRWKLTVSTHRGISLLVWVLWLEAMHSVFCLTIVLIIKCRSLSSIFIKINYARKQFGTINCFFKIYTFAWTYHNDITDKQFSYMATILFLLLLLRDPRNIRCVMLTHDTSHKSLSSFFDGYQSRVVMAALSPSSYWQ